ncbi:MAG: nucleotidyltransferase domain-containing protein [Candidatus Bathyarchaeia archaeon]|jgi:predicted nucleotidyltransferase
MRLSYDTIRFYKLDSERRKSIIRRLKEDLAREEKIKLGLVFGSLTTRHSVRDVDVCIYSVPIMDFKELLDINARVELDIGIPVDISELSNLPPSLRIDILRHGILAKGSRSFSYQLLDQAYAELMAIKTIIS